MIIASRPSSANKKEQSYIYEVTGPENTKLTVAIVLKAGMTSDAVVISHIPLGSYQVKEQHPWSWRYSDGGTKSAEVVADALAKVTFDHTLDRFEWLNGYSHRYSK